MGYWHRAGVLETERSAYLEAIAHLQNGLDLLHMLPETPERRQHQLTVLTTLGPAFMATKGYTSPEAENTYRRAHALCQQIEDSPQLFAVQRGLWSYYSVRGESQTALALAQQCLDVAQRGDEAILVVEAHMMLGSTLMRRGELMSALTHLHQGIRLYDALPQRFPRFVQDAGVGCRCYAARALWYLGHPDQARTHSHEALALAQHLDHPFSIMFSQYYMAYISRLLRESHTVKEQAEAAVISAKEQGFWFVEAGGAMLRGWSLMQHDDTAESIAQIRQGLAQWRSDRIGGNLLLWFDLVAEAYGLVGQVQEGLHVVDDALTLVDKHGIYDAELYRLKGTLLLQQPSGNAEEAESCYHQAIQIAQEQSAKSWELRAATSLARLWQSQGKRDEARQLLGDVYDWFTEGFDTADLRAAKALLDELPPVGT
jgi:predicted ATPase